MNPSGPDMPRIAVVGAGRRGAPLIQALDALGALRAVCDLDPTALAPFAARADLRTTADYLALVADPDLDAVVLATPAGTREGMARAALIAGKHVLASGLAALRAEDAASLVALAESRGRVLLGGPALPSHPALMTLRERIPEIGALHYLHAEQLAPPGDRDDDAPVWGFAPDLLAALLAVGGRLERVQAHASAALDPAVVDVTVTHLTFASGLRAHLHVSWLHPFRHWRLTVLGEAGALVLEDGAVALHTGGDIVAVPVPEGGPAEALARRFVEAVRGPAERDAGVAVLRVAEAAQRSLDEDRPVGPPSRAPAPPALEKPMPPGVRVHPSVVVDGEVEIGEGTAIWHFSKLLGPCRIGRNCTFGQNVVVERHVVVGDNVKIQNNVSVYSGVILEDDVFCGPSMVFTNVGTPRSAHPRRGQYTTTLVKRGASIGANATVVCGHTLGRYCFVGAGAVVTRDVPDYALVYGNPARVRGFACFCGHTLPLGTDAASSEAATCPECGRRYAREGQAVTELTA